MSEFSATEKDRASPASPASSTRSASPGWWTRPIIAGLPLPGLIIVLLILVGAAWILFGPDSPPSVNQLAFREDIEPRRVTPEGTRPSHSALSPLETGGRQFKDEVATMIGGVRGYAETNRTAISTLSATVKSQGAVLATVQQQLAESQAQNSVLSARLSFLEGRPRAQAASQQPPKTQLTAKHVARTRSPLSGMRVEAIQKGMAWVYWQDRTWAVKAGDSVGPVTVTRIDAQAREVHTSAGTLK